MDHTLTRVLLPCVDTLQADGDQVRCVLLRDHDGPHHGGTTDTDILWRRRWDLT